jgi:hypothetical protein
VAIIGKIVYDESKKNKDLLQPKNLDLFTQVTEMGDELAEESDEELTMHTSPCRTQLSKPANKIVKPCSLFSGLSWLKKGEDPQRIKMTSCFVNIRGVEHPDKQRFLRETIREEGVCFIGLCETIKSNFTPNWLKKIAGNRNFALESVPPVGRSGGLLLGVDTNYQEVLETETGKHFIRM